MAMVPPPDDVTFDTTFWLGVASTGALAFGIFRAVVYFNVQYFIAALVGKHVPRGGARVLDLGIREGRNLYYYPPDTVQVVAVSAKPDLQLLESQSASAKVPIRFASDYSKIPANSMDAVVSVYGMAEMSDEEAKTALKEAVRVLKPGKPFIYVENVGSENGLVRALQGVIESIGKATGSNFQVTRDVLPIIQNTEGLEDLQYENILTVQDPHLCGVARKKAGNSPTPSSGISRERPRGVGIGKERPPKARNDDAPQKIEFPGQ